MPAAIPSAIATAAAVRSGALTARGAVEAAIARIEAADGAINAVVVRDFARAIDTAEEMDRYIRDGFDAPLLGVPMTVKESFDVAGLPTTFGLAEHRDHIARADALAVTRLKHAGAIVLGKTNVPPNLADLQSDNPVYGRTRNAIDPTRSAGGSSGGGAVAVASGMVPIEFGSDIGGSIRVPAAFNGIVGHKPTWGVLPTDGHHFPGTDGARTALSVIGPLARDTADLALLLDLVADHPLAAAAKTDAADLHVLILTAHPLGPVAAAIAAAVEAAGDALARAGARVDRTSDLVPDLARQHRHYWAMLQIAMARGVPAPGATAPTLADWLDLHDEQARCQRAWRALFETYDVVIAPVLGTTAFPHDDRPLATRTLVTDGVEAPFFHQFAWSGIATFPMLPATSVPVGRDADGLPIGAQVIAAPFADHQAIAVAAMLARIQEDHR